MSSDSETRPARQSLFRRLGPAGALGVLWALLPALFGFYLLAKIDPVSEFLQEQKSAGLLIYIGVFVVTAGFGLLPTYAQAVLGGWVFGFWRGIGGALIGFTGAALLGYAVARLVTRDRVEKVIEENERAAAIRRALIGRGFFSTLGIITLLRIPPNAPFALSNLAMAGAGVRLAPYALGTMLGMAPRTAVFVAAAAAASRTGATDIQSFVKEGPGLMILIAGLVTLFIVLAVIGTIANRAVERVTRSS